MLNGPKILCRVANGKLVLVARGAGVPAAAIRRYGWAWDATGAGYFQDATAGVPASARRSRGIAFTDDGAIYTIDAAPGAGAISVDGFSIRADGALHINTGNASGQTKGGVARDNGRVFA